MIAETEDPSNTGQKLVERNVRGQFVKGARGNPRGKPRGARHRTTRIAESILATNAKGLLQRAVDLALGDRGGPTLRALLPFLVAPHRDRPIVFELPPLTTISDSLRALDAIAAGLATGQLTAAEADALTSIVGRYIDATEAIELKARVDALELRLQQGVSK
jgi:hypothetical protein